MKKMFARTPITRIIARGFVSTTVNNSGRNEFARIAVVGTGRMGRIRIKAIKANENAQVSHIVTEPQSVASLANELRKTHTTSNVKTSLDDVLNDPTVNGVWLSTPTHTHLELIERVARAGKHIAVEKPVAASLHEIEAAYDLSEKYNVRLFCSYQRRFDPSYVALQNATQRGDIGSIQSIISVFRDHPMPPLEFLRTGGDPFHDLAVHDIDYVCNLLGDYPDTVLASGFSLTPELREANVMDKATVWLHFKSGVVCMMDISRGSSYGYDQRVEVFGENGMLQVQNQPKTSMVVSSSSGISQDVHSHSFPERFSEAYANEVEHFVDIIVNGATPKVSRKQAKMSTIIAEAAKISAMKNTLVKLVDSPNAEDVDYEYPQVDHK